MRELEELRKAIVQFTQERDWDQFHNGKDLALALSIEAAELNEAFLWKDASKVNVDKVKEELADIFNYAILIADKYDLDKNAQVAHANIAIVTSGILGKGPGRSTERDFLSQAFSRTMPTTRAILGHHPIVL